MPRLGKNFFAHEELTVAANACVAAWDDIAGNGGLSGPAGAELRRTIALRIMDAVANGERDLERLKLIALRKMDGA